MSEKPEALRLADALDERWHRWKDDPTYELKAAAELRRLHAENSDFRAAVHRLHAAKNRYHTQIAACDLFDLFGLKNERPTK